MMPVYTLYYKVMAAKTKVWVHTAILQRKIGFFTNFLNSMRNCNSSPNQPSSSLSFEPVLDVDKLNEIKLLACFLNITKFDWLNLNTGYILSLWSHACTFRLMSSLPQRFVLRSNISCLTDKTEERRKFRIVQAVLLKQQTIPKFNLNSDANQHCGLLEMLNCNRRFLVIDLTRWKKYLR